MANKNDDVLLVVGGIIATIAGLFGLQYVMSNNNNQNTIIEKKSSCNKCPFSKE